MGKNIVEVLHMYGDRAILLILFWSQRHWVGVTGNRNWCISINIHQENTTVSTRPWIPSNSKWDTYVD